MEAIKMFVKIYPKPFGLIAGNEELHRFLSEFLIENKKKKIIEKIGKKR